MSSSLDSNRGAIAVVSGVAAVALATFWANSGTERPVAKPKAVASANVNGADRGGEPKPVRQRRWWSLTPVLEAPRKWVGPKPKLPAGCRTAVVRGCVAKDALGWSGGVTTLATVGVVR